MIFLLLSMPFVFAHSVLDLQINTGLKDITAIAKIASLKQLVLKGNGGKVVPGFASKLTNLE